MWDCYKDRFKLQEVGDNFQMLQGGSVTSVNGKVGAVVLTAEDVGALPDTYEAPVTSVNTQTGDVVLDAGDIAYESTTVEDELGTINSALTSLQSVTEIIDTASGAIASFPDGSGLPMRSLVAQINPVQDLHGYENPWPAGGGANQWDEDWENGYYNRSTGAKDGNSNTTYFRSKNYIPCAPNTSYYFKAPSVHASNATYYAVLFYDADKSYISAINSNIGNTAQTTPQNAQFMTFYIEVGTSGATYQNDIAINYPATVTTYSPYSNICPISGHTGLSVEVTGNNLLPNKKYQDTSIRVQLGQESADYFPMKAGTYKLSYGLISGVSAGPYWRVRGGSVQNSTNIVLSEDSEIQIWLYANPISASDVLWFQLELGSTASTYEPFTGTTTTVSWQDTAGTVYGGTATYNGDGTWTLVAEYADVDVGALDVTWNYNVADTGAFNTTTELTPTPKENNGLCSSYKKLENPISSSIASNDFFFAINKKADGDKYTGNYATGVLIVKDTKYTDVASFKSAMSGVHLVFELATPQTYTITTGELIDTLLCQNNVWHDANGDTTVTYQANLKGYIDKVLGQ